MLTLSVNALSYQPDPSTDSLETASTGSNAGRKTAGEPTPKYKTEMCRNWAAGYCEFGGKCAFAHGNSELRSRVLLASKYKTKLCKQFFSLGYCFYGPRCQFKHIRDLALPSSPLKRRLPVFISLQRKGESLGYL